MKVLGPYRHTTGSLAGRAYIVINKADGRKTTKLYSRYVMEQHLGRDLTYDETVDHIDNDKTNDDLTNLQVISRVENVKKDRLLHPPETQSFICPNCGVEFQALARRVRHNQVSQGKRGPYCSRSCASKHTR